MTSPRSRDGAAVEVREPVTVVRPAGVRAKSGPLPRVTPRALQGVLVLVVDDHDDTRAMLAEYLAWQGAHPIEARSVAEAIDVLERRAVDLVLTDVAMPQEDGYALLARMDARPGWAAIPRIVASGHSSISEAAERAPRAAYLGKPVDLEVLAGMIARALRADG